MRIIHMFARQYGWTRTEVMGMPWREIQMHEDEIKREHNASADPSGGSDASYMNGDDGTRAMLDAEARLKAKRASSR